MKTLAAYLVALARHWISRFLLLLGIASTLATYVSSFVPGFTVPRWLPLLFFIAALLVGSFDLYRTQIEQIERLRSDIQLRNGGGKRASLVLGIHERSVFFRHAPDRNRVVGIYLHLEVSVENKGTRASVISKYHLRIQETGTDLDVRPRGFSSIQGLAFSWGIDTTRKNLALDGYIRVPPDDLAGPEILPFYLDVAPPVEFHVLHCTLGLYDTNGEYVEASFELPEHR